MIVKSDIGEKGRTTYTCVSAIGIVRLVAADNRLLIVKDDVVIGQLSLCDLYDLAIESISKASSKGSSSIRRRKIEINIIKQARLLLNL